MPAVVQVSHLTKIFRVPEREGGLAAALRSLFKRQWREVHAVEDISFEIEAAVVALCFGAALTVFTRWFWRFGLKRYSGASA